MVVLLMSSAAGADEVAARDPGFELGVRTGYALPFGKMDGASKDINDSVSGQIPLWLDVGYRVTPNLVVAAYGQLGIGLLKKDCTSGTDCSVKDWRFGLAARYHFQPTSNLDPWISAGAGYEIFSIDGSQGSASASVTANGWELVNLQAGVDFQVSRAAYFGPFVSFSLDETTSENATATIPGMGTISASTSDFDKSLHEWLLIGVRGRYEL
jgi:outer membrane protein W